MTQKEPNKRQPQRIKRRGAVALECALVLPIFILCVFGIVEIGRAIMVHQIITNSAREGARRAVIPGATDNQVYQTIDDYMSDAGLSGHTRQISPSLASANSKDMLTVTLSVPYSQVHWGLMNWLGNAEMKATVVMRKE